MVCVMLGFDPASSNGVYSFVCWVSPHRTRTFPIMGDFDRVVGLREVGEF